MRLKILQVRFIGDETSVANDLEGGFGRLTQTNVTNNWESSSFSISGSKVKLFLMMIYYLNLYEL